MTTTSTSFARNWLLLVSSNIAAQLLNMVASIRIARILNPDGFGLFNLALTIAGIGAVVGAVGMRNVIIRETARNAQRSNELFRISFLLRIPVFGVVGLGTAAYAIWGPAGVTADLGMAALAIVAGMVLWDLCESIAFGFQRMAFTSGINFLGSCCWILLVYASPASMLTPFAVTSAYAGIQIIRSVVYYVSLRRHSLIGTTETGGFSVDAARPLLVQSLPFFWLALLTMVVIQVPVVLLASRADLAEVAFFNVGFRLVNPIQMIIGAAMTALFPGLSRAHVGDTTRYMWIIRRTIAASVVLGSLMALGVSVMRQEIILVLFGERYLPAADAMVLQAWYTVLFSIFSVIGTSLGARDQQVWLARLATAYTVVALPAIWIGADFGARGMALAMLLAALVNITYHWIVFQKSLPEKLSTWLWTRLLLFFVTLLVLSWFLADMASLVVRIIILCVAFGGTFYLGYREWRRRQLTSEADGDPEPTGEGGSGGIFGA